MGYEAGGKGGRDSTVHVQEASVQALQVGPGGREGGDRGLGRVDSGEGSGGREHALHIGRRAWVGGVRG